MGMVPEEVSGARLVTERKMVGPATSDEDGKGKTKGDRAFMDAVIIVAVAWGILFALVWSLRQYNV